MPILRKLWTNEIITPQVKSSFNRLMIILLREMHGTDSFLDVTFIHTEIKGGRMNSNIS